MAVTWAQGEMQATLAAAGGQLPSGAVRQAAGSVAHSGPEAPSRGPRGHLGPQAEAGSPAQPAWCQSCEPRPRVWSSPRATRRVLRKPSACATPSEATAQLPQVGTAGVSQPHRKTEKMKLRGQVICRDPAASRWQRLLAQPPGGSGPAAPWLHACGQAAVPLSASAISRYVPASPGCWNPPRGLSLNALLTVP